MRRPLPALALVSALALTLVLAACSSSGTDEPAGTTAATTTAETTTAPMNDADVGQALQAFVEAAGRRDVAGMWSLLAPATQKRLGPTQNDFAERYGQDFERGLGSFAGTEYTVIVSVAMPSGWGVAAIAGDRVRSGKSEFAAYGAALRQEGGWKLVLDDPVAIRNLAPEGRTTSERRPPIGVRITADAAVAEAGVWLDGSPLPAQVHGTDGRDIRIEGTPEAALAPGWHVIVAFGSTGDVAAAAARPFEVKSSGSGSGQVA